MDVSTQPEIDSSKLNGLIQIRWYKRGSVSICDTLVASPLKCQHRIIQSLRGHSCAREVQRKFFHKWLETYLRCKKIEGDRLKSWCGPRNPRWPPRWRPIFLKMTVYIKLATTTCFYLVFGLKMIILEENGYK